MQTCQIASSRELLLVLVLVPTVASLSCPWTKKSGLSLLSDPPWKAQIRRKVALNRLQTPTSGTKQESYPFVSTLSRRKNPRKTSTGQSLLCVPRNPDLGQLSLVLFMQEMNFQRSSKIISSAIIILYVYLVSTLSIIQGKKTVKKFSLNKKLQRKE